MRKTRRRARYTWLPTLGTAGPEGTGDDNMSGRVFTLFPPTDGSSEVVITPLTFDQVQEGDDLNLANNPLGTVLGNEYFIKRIVGKLLAGVRAKRNVDNDPSTQPAILFGAGFFIARANDSSQGADSPIGSASASERQENYSPLSEDVIREPWIWRRTWILGNSAFTFQNVSIWTATATPPTEQGGAAFPPTTAHYGSLQDGPHIDAKTARRVKQDERLWFVVAARAAPFDVTVTVNETVVVDGYLDFRILGALRKARQGSAF